MGRNILLIIRCMEWVPLRPVRGNLKKNFGSTYDSFMNDLKESERTDKNSVFKCFTSHSASLTWDTPAWRRCIDDRLLWAKDLKTTFIQVMRYLSFCERRGIVFNPKKLRQGEKEMGIFGLKMTQQGMKPTDNQIFEGHPRLYGPPQLVHLLPEWTIKKTYGRFEGKAEENYNLEMD